METDDGGQQILVSSRGEAALRQPGAQRLIAVHAAARVLDALRGAAQQNQPKCWALPCMASLYMVRIFS